MLLFETVINGTTYYVSNELLDLTHVWDAFVFGFDMPRKQISQPYGGQVVLGFGSITFSPELFLTEGFPPINIDITAKYTETTEDAAVTLFTAKGHRLSVNAREVKYDLYENVEDINLLDEGTDYNGETIVLPRAFGEVIHHTPYRLPDRGGNPTYDLAHITGTLAKAIPYIYNNGSDQIRVVSTAHGFSNGDTVTLELAEDFNHAYNDSGVISNVTANTFDIATIASEAVDFMEYYSEDNQNIGYGLGMQGFDYGSCGQCFVLTEECWIVGALFYVNKGGAYTDQNFTFRLAGITGTIPNALPDYTGTIYASAVVNTSVVTEVGYHLFAVEFDAPYLAVAGNYALWVTSQYRNPVDPYYGLFVGAHNAGTHGGNLAYYDGTWYHPDDYDMCFYIYGSAGSLTGHAYKSGYYRIYDDGVPIPSNVTNNGDNTFSLSATPAGEVTVSGTGDAGSTLTDIVEWACGANFLNVTFDGTYERVVSPTISFLAYSQNTLVSFLSDMCASWSHMFDLTDGTNLYLIDMKIDRGSRDVTEFEFMPSDYSAIASPVKKISAAWQERTRADEVNAGKYIKTEDMEEPVLSRFKYADAEMSIEPYSLIRSDINGAINDILTSIHSDPMRLVMPLDDDPPLLGEKISLTDTRLHTNVFTWIRTRSIQFDYVNHLITVEGEGLSRAYWYFRETLAIADVPTVAIS